MARNSKNASVRKNILIVDDHPIIRRGLKALIESEPDLVVCAEADTLNAALLILEENEPDLVIVDLMLAQGDGLQLVKAIKKNYPWMPALVLTMHDETVYAERSFRAGAHGFVTKQQLDDTVLVAIRRLLKGGKYMSDRLQGQLAEKYVGGLTVQSSNKIDALSDRELQVFRQIGLGKTTRQIAESFSLSVKTIDSHREHIKDKLGLVSSAELVRHAVRWVETDEIQ